MNSLFEIISSLKRLQRTALSAVPRLGISESFGILPIHPHANTFLELSRQYLLTISDGVSLRRSLLNGDLDIAIIQSRPRPGPGQKNDAADDTLEFNVPMVALSNSEHVWGEGAAECTEIDLVVGSEGGDIAAFVISWIQQHRIKCRISCHLDDPLLQVDYVALHGGVAIIPITMLGIVLKRHPHLCYSVIDATMRFAIEHASKSIATCSLIELYDLVSAYIDSEASVTHATYKN